jgi:hypothetical protein
VLVGCDGDTAAFAVKTLCRWWTHVGRPACPTAHRLLVTADSGSSSSSRARLWKVELARLSAQTGLAIIGSAKRRAV